jgi:hypothetical protein
MKIVLEIDEKIVKNLLHMTVEQFQIWVIKEINYSMQAYINYNKIKKSDEKNVN